MSNIPLIDYLALACFLLCWTGYAGFAKRKARTHPSLLGTMQKIRRRWVMAMLRRENRVVDASTVTNLLAGTTFFASTSMLVIGGLAAVLQSGGQAIQVMAELPFAVRQSEALLELKIASLVATFGYAFFEFTWSMRQHNFVSSLVGAAPATTQDLAPHQKFIEHAGRVAYLAGESFNQGLRAYYFALAELTWFVSPLLFMGASLGVAAILYWREFHSRTLDSLTGLLAALEATDPQP